MAEAYTAPPDDESAERAGDSRAGTPAQQRELRAQGRRTMQRLLDAGLEVFSTRGYHATRVDDVVRVAKTSHGTFYLYFANKEDLLRALAVDCAAHLTELSEGIGPIDSGPAGFAELRRFLGAFLEVYRRYGPVIRAWMEGQVGDTDVDRLGIKAFSAISEELAARMRTAGAVGDDAVAVTALMAMIERFSYVVASRRMVGDDDAVIDTLAHIVHRGFFGAPGAAPDAG
ncbi:MAG: TetR/AcrR family transcriptional regulator [Actinobacteria bacterium]|nr:TetR/AcrR family transcriptional regulator [Actinomycetota bacterium]